jgi:hypothetical protein
MVFHASVSHGAMRPSDPARRPRRPNGPAPGRAADQQKIIKTRVPLTLWIMASLASGGPILPNIDELLGQYAPEISALRESVKEIPPATDDSTDWDDIWLLRWVLSYDDSTAREEALRKAIAYRFENAQALKDAQDGKSAPFDDLIQRFSIVGFHKCTKFGEPVCASSHTFDFLHRLIVPLHFLLFARTRHGTKQFLDSIFFIADEHCSCRC